MCPSEGDAWVAVDAQDFFPLDARGVGIENLVLKENISAKELFLNLLQRLGLKAEMRVVVPQLEGNCKVVRKNFHNFATKDGNFLCKNR
jgi:hypothetical protein